MKLQSFVIFLAAAFFVLYGLAFSLLPVEMSLLVTGSEPQGISALVDFRATYGGMTVAVGISLLYLHSIKQYRPGLVIVIIVLLSMAITRAFGMLSDGGGNAFMSLYLALEILGSALALFAMRGSTG